MIGIVIALQSEANALLKKVENLKNFTLANKTAYSCSICGRDTIIIISGIGKVNAALSTQLLIDKYSPAFIINFGTCGGMNDSVKILNYYAVEKCCQFDFDLRELDGVPLGYIQDYDSVFFPACTEGLSLDKSSVASADRFTNDLTDINSINEIGCSLRDMEGGSIAQVCYSNNISLYMIKGVTDVFGSETAQDQFYKNLQQVSAGFPDVVISAIHSICRLKGI